MAQYLLYPGLLSLSKIASGKLVFANDGREAKQRRVVEATNQKEMKRRKREESVEVNTGRIKNNEYFIQIPFS